MTTPDTGDDAGDETGDDAGHDAGDDADAGDAGAGDERGESPVSDRDDPEETGAGTIDESDGAAETSAGSDADAAADADTEADAAAKADTEREADAGAEAKAEAEQASAGEPAEAVTPEERPPAANVPDGEEVPGVAAPADRSDLTGPERRLDPRIRYVWIVQSVILAAVFGAFGGAVGIGLDFGPLVGVAVFAVVAALGIAHSVLRFRSWRYQVRGDSLYLERGVLTHVKTVVPYVRIQHVDASRGPLERLIGLASSVVYTAGSRGADVTIPGLTPEHSEELQSRLEQLAIAAEGDDAV